MTTDTAVRVTRMVVQDKGKQSSPTRHLLLKLISSIRGDSLPGLSRAEAG